MTIDKIESAGKNEPTDLFNMTIRLHVIKTFLRKLQSFVR